MLLEMLTKDINSEIFLLPSPTINFKHEAVRRFIEQYDRPDSIELERAVSLYYAVRDQIRYDPYTASSQLSDFSASRTLETGRGWCVPKAILYAACCRSIGIPARLGYADVRNHMSTANLRRLMGTDIFHWHGYTDVYLEGKWVKATPAFNIELCDKFHLKPLEFDGLEDSIYHPFDLAGRKHMEYLAYHGVFDDIPFDRIMNDFARYYPKLAASGLPGDFDREVDRETIQN